MFNSKIILISYFLLFILLVELTASATETGFIRIVNSTMGYRNFLICGLLLLGFSSIRSYWGVLGIFPPKLAIIRRSLLFWSDSKFFSWKFLIGFYVVFQLVMWGVYFYHFIIDVPRSGSFITLGVLILFNVFFAYVLIYPFASQWIFIMRLQKQFKSETLLEMQEEFFRTHNMRIPLVLGAYECAVGNDYRRGFRWFFIFLLAQEKLPDDLRHYIEASPDELKNIFVEDGYSSEDNYCNDAICLWQYYHNFLCKKTPEEMEQCWPVKNGTASQSAWHPLGCFNAVRPVPVPSTPPSFWTISPEEKSIAIYLLIFISLAVLVSLGLLLRRFF